MEGIRAQRYSWYLPGSTARDDRHCPGHLDGGGGRAHTALHSDAVSAARIRPGPVLPVDTHRIPSADQHHHRGRLGVVPGPRRGRRRDADSASGDSGAAVGVLRLPGGHRCGDHRDLRRDDHVAQRDSATRPDPDADADRPAGGTVRSGDTAADRRRGGQQDSGAGGGSCAWHADCRPALPAVVHPLGLEPGLRRAPTILGRQGVLAGKRARRLVALPARGHDLQPRRRVALLRRFLARHG